MKLICGVIGHRLPHRKSGVDARRQILQSMIEMMSAPNTPSGFSRQIKTWIQGPVALATIGYEPLELSGAMTSGDLANCDGTILAADLSLYEEELLSSMLGLAHPDAVLSSSELKVAHALSRRRIRNEKLLALAMRRWPAEVFNKINGEFAFAAFNVREGRLLCARDIMGVRPFFYSYRPGRWFAFASLPKAIYGAKLCSDTLNSREFVARLNHLRGGTSDSIFAEIQCLPPAHTLNVEVDIQTGAVGCRGGISLQRYWNLPLTPPETAQSLNLVNPSEAAQELAALLKKSVQCRVDSSFNPATHLSGGLDSSALTVLVARARAAQAKRLSTYSFFARQPEDFYLADEWPYVKSVLDQERNIDNVGIRRGLLDDTLSPATDTDGPYSISDEHPEQQVCIHARNAGIDVIFSGWGGDQAATFNGRGSLAEMLVQGQWAHVLAEGYSISALTHSSMGGVLRKELVPYLLQHLKDQWDSDYLSAKAGNKAGSAGLPMRQFSANTWANRRTLLTFSSITNRAENWALIGARHALAFTFPLLDRRIIEFSMQMPGSLFLRDGWKRRLFRDAMAGILPDEIRWRRGKFAPFPCQALEMSSRREQVALRIAQLKSRKKVAELVDLNKMESILRSAPSPTVIRDCAMETEDGRRQMSYSHVALSRYFVFASFIEQHHAT